MFVYHDKTKERQIIVGGPEEASRGSRDSQTLLFLYGANFTKKLTCLSVFLDRKLILINEVINEVFLRL